MKSSSALHLLAEVFAAAATVVALGCSGTDKAPAQGEAKKAASTTPAPDNHQAMSDSVQKNVDNGADDKASEKQKKIVEEAVSALNETHNALRALDEKKPSEALAALERATGKLELVLAREPSLSLAPTGVSMSKLDLLTTLDGIENAKAEVKEALKEGQIQKARGLLNVLGSEVVVHVTSIPLASYPAAIKAVTPLIDNGKIDEAKKALTAALRTLVVTDHVIPLPVVRAEAMLKDADALAQKKNREQKDNEKLTGLLKNSRYQIEMAEALGYGTKDNYKALYEQLDKIETMTQGGQSGTGFFDKIMSSIASMKKSVFG